MQIANTKIWIFKKSVAMNGTRTSARMWKRLLMNCPWHGLISLQYFTLPPLSANHLQESNRPTTVIKNGQTKCIQFLQRYRYKVKNNTIWLIYKTCIQLKNKFKDNLIWTMCVEKLLHINESYLKINSLL
jgi:hypothetical protein